MSFRDEEEALRARLRDAEGALAAARDSLEVVRKDAEDVPELRKRVRLLEAETEALRRGVLPGQRTKLGGVALAVSVIAIGALTVLYGEMSDSLERAARAAETERRAADERYATLEAELDRANTALVEANDARLAAERARDAIRPPAPASDTFRFPIVTATRSTTFMTTARVSSVTGDAPVRRGAECTVAVTLDGGDECRGQVLCGEEELYPRDGDGGYFGCVHDDDRNFVSGADVGTTALDGDPRIDLDRARGTAIIGEGPSPSWEVTVRFAR